MPALSAAVAPPGWTLPCKTILSVSRQLLIVEPSASVHVPTMPGPDTRILLKPVGEPTTACGVELSPMKPAGGAPAPVLPKVSQVRNGPMTPLGPPSAALKFPATTLVSLRHVPDALTRP